MDHHKIDHVELGSKVRNSLNYVVRAAIERKIVDDVGDNSLDLYPHMGDEAYTQAGILIKRDEVSGLYIPDCTSQMIHGGFDIFTVDDGNVIWVARNRGKLEEGVYEARKNAHSPITNRTDNMLSPQEITEVVREGYQERWQEVAQNLHKNPSAGTNEKIFRLMHDQNYRTVWRDWSTLKLDHLHKQSSTLNEEGQPELIALIEHYKDTQ